MLPEKVISCSRKEQFIPSGGKKTMHLLRLVTLALLLHLIAVNTIAAADSATVPLNDPSAELDPISSGCFTCHDGANGPHVTFCLLGKQGCGGHIVSVSYAEVVARNEKFHPASRLPPELVLYEGKITCVTCHGTEPHQGTPLVMDNNNGSALCRACHRK